MNLWKRFVTNNSRRIANLVSGGAGRLFAPRIATEDAEEVGEFAEVTERLLRPVVIFMT